MTAGTAKCGPACLVVWKPGLAYWVSLRPPDWMISSLSDPFLRMIKSGDLMRWLMEPSASEK
jgi:hypothetical protein